ncbi:MAG: hypothetical protein GY941_10745 [Planctomycetes bacterium]|nr:hypothetical protein [Planctomycetota bacterium]
MNRRITFTNTVLLTIALSFGLNVMMAGKTEALIAQKSTTILKADPPPAKEERIAFAKGLLEEIDLLHSVMPALSPTQKKWIGNQLSSSNTNRKNRAYESDEFIMQTTKSKIGEIKNILEKIIEGHFLGQLQDQRSEVINWLYVSTGLIDFYIPWGISKLISRNLITIPDDGSFKELDTLGLRFNGIGNSILSAIVGTYIMGKLPEE